MNLDAFHGRDERKGELDSIHPHSVDFYAGIFFLFGTLLSESFHSPHGCAGHLLVGRRAWDG